MNSPSMSSSSSGTQVHPNADKLSKNPALQELDIYATLEIFKGVPPDYAIQFTEEQKDEILNFLNDLYTEMHSDRITKWNSDVYKNVKKDRNQFITEEKEENRVVNIVGFMEMLLELEKSPFFFSFEEDTNRLMVQNYNVKNDLPI